MTPLKDIRQGWLLVASLKPLEWITKKLLHPLQNMNTIKVLLSIAVNYEWSMYQMDVKNVVFAW